MNLSITEENYLKAIFKLSSNGDKATTNEIALAVNTKAASVTDMLKKLSDKNLITYQKYQGVFLTEEGDILAKKLIRKHRLWEVFLVNKLGFTWDEVHPIAEQLEHIQSPELVQKLDAFLGCPKFDPHGDPIPDEKGNIIVISDKLLSDIAVNTSVIIVGVKNTETSFLQFLDKLKISLGVELHIKEKIAFDQSLLVEMKNKPLISLSNQVAANLFVKEKI